MTLAKFTGWAVRLGCEQLSSEDLAQLHRGLLGQQPQFERLRLEHHRLLHPQLGA
jgi:hypothetical protein